MINRNWRIEYISHAQPGKPMLHTIHNPMGIVSLFGMLLFLGGFIYLFVKRSEAENLVVPITLCVVGLVLAIVSNLLHEKLRKQNWIQVEAKCLDHELIEGRNRENGRVFALRALCEFELNGEAVRCTPESWWPARRGEAPLTNYIRDPGMDFAASRLRVNPENPREVEFIEQV